MQDTERNLLQLYVEDLKHIYGKYLRSVILYGSCARGDQTDTSDIDIMILVDLSEKEIAEKSRTLSDVTFDYNFDHDLEIMPIVKNTEHFNKWLRAYPFYNNVKREGIELYAA